MAWRWWERKKGKLPQLHSQKEKRGETQNDEAAKQKGGKGESRNWSRIEREREGQLQIPAIKCSLTAREAGREGRARNDFSRVVERGGGISGVICWNLCREESVTNIYLM